MLVPFKCKMTFDTIYFSKNYHSTSFPLLDRNCVVLPQLRRALFLVTGIWPDSLYCKYLKEKNLMKPESADSNLEWDRDKRYT